MRVDLTNRYNDGIKNLLNWRSRYSKNEYPSKIVINIFYRQYTMNSIWESEMENSFTQFKNTEKDIITAFQKLENEYSFASQKFTIGNTLIDLMNKQQVVGGLNYKNNLPLISKGQNGDNKAIEELEFTYLHYYLCNTATLMWAGFGRMGFSKNDSITQVTGAVIEYKKEITYTDILGMLGQLGIAQTISKLYKPLTNLF